MPVGTHGAIKALQIKELLDFDTKIILANTYHLHLAPGADLIKKAQGLHRFMGWERALLTDSGGFQVFSLQKKTIQEEGACFLGPNGKNILLSPETSLEIQQKLGADIIMAFDECIPHPATAAYTEESIARTHRWLQRSINAWNSPTQSLFGIIQGSSYPHLRRRCVEEVCQHDLPGYAIGGVSVGEGTELMAEVVNFTAPLLPAKKPRYVMGVGNPEDLLMIWEQGIDMSDCIIPTKFARGGTIFTNRGKIRIRHQNYRRDFFPLEPNCPCWVCRTHTRAYLKHLFDANEILGAILATHHNLAFYQTLATKAREAIFANRFRDFKKQFLANYQNN